MPLPIPPNLQGVLGKSQVPPGMPSSAPVGASMSSAEPKSGDIAQGKNLVTVAMKMLEQALLSMGSESDEGRVVLETISKLSKHFHKEENNELIPAQLMSVLQSMPQAGLMKGGAEAPPAPPPGMPPPGAAPQPPMM